MYTFAHQRGFALFAGLTALYLGILLSGCSDLPSKDGGGPGAPPPAIRPDGDFLAGLGGDKTRPKANEAPKTQKSGLITEKTLNISSFSAIFEEKTSASSPGEISLSSGATKIENNSKVLFEKLNFLVNAGWPRVAANIANNFQIPTTAQTEEVLGFYRKLGLQLGDPVLFWKGKAPLQSSDDYWRKNISHFIGTDRKWRILQGWPKNEVSPERIMNLLLVSFFRPDKETTSELFATLATVFPEELRIFFSPIFKEFGNSIPTGVIALVFYPDPRQPPLKRLCYTGVFLEIGFSWAFVRKALVNIPEKFKGPIVSWAQSEGDFETLLDLLKDPEKFPDSDSIRDFLLTMPPQSFESKFGSDKIAGRMRSHGRKILEKMNFSIHEPASHTKLVLEPEDPYPIPKKQRVPWNLGFTTPNLDSKKDLMITIPTFPPVNLSVSSPTRRLQEKTGSFSILLPDKTLGTPPNSARNAEFSSESARIRPFFGKGFDFPPREGLSGNEK